MQNTLTGIHGNIQEHCGKQAAIIVPFSIAKKLEAAIEIETDLVPEQTVLQMFHKTKKRLCNMRSDGSIPKCDYTVAFDKSRWYWLSKLLRIKHIFSRKKAA